MLNKTPININFSQGIDTKSDPYQVPVGTFLTLVNSVFDTTGRLTKRFGFQKITSLPNPAITLTTYKSNLIALGTTLQAYNEDSNQWVDAGPTQSVKLTTLPVIRSSTGQSQVDVAVASNGLACVVWADTDNNNYYSVVDNVTGQIIVSKVALPATAMNPRAYALNKYLIVTFISTVSSTNRVCYISIPTTDPSEASGVIALAATTPAATTSAYDAYVAYNVLYIAYASTGSAIKIITLNSNLSQGYTATIGSHVATYMSVTVDTTTTSPVVWVSFWDSGSHNGYSAAYSQILGVLQAPTIIISGETSVVALTSSAVNQILTFFYEIQSTYAYSITTRTDHVMINAISQGGAAGTPSVLLRGVGLASKSFYFPYNGKTYVLLAYGQAYQPTYFLADEAGNIICKIAYSNGGGYVTSQILSNININGSVVQFAYRYADLLVSVSKVQTVTPIPGLYSQTGLNIASIDFNSQQSSAEIAGDLHLTGGFMAMYDGSFPVEHQFHVWPEDLQVAPASNAGSLIPQTYYYQATYEWTDSQGNIHRSAPSVPVTVTLQTPSGTFTGNITNGSPIVTSVSAFTALQTGQGITGTGIPAGTFILTINIAGDTLTMSNNATSGSGTPTTFTASPATSAIVNIPYLRLTAKTNARVMLYRWSTAQQEYFQISSITSPNINFPNNGVDSFSFVDTVSDASIQGNPLIYTTGGVIEDIAAPATNLFTLWQSRLFLVDAEDKNLIWFSKQVIENVPIEMSDLLTLYIAPTLGAQGSTGPITALTSMDDKLIIFKTDAVYYITGTGPDNTGSNGTFSDPVFITSTVGCTNPSSIVLMPTGIMFQSDKGIWLLSRDLATNYIGAPVEAYNNQSVVAANAIPGTNQVRFILDTSITLMYDYYFQQWSTHTNLNAISATLYQGNHTYITNLNTVYQELNGSYVDDASPVLMSLTTAWINIGGLQGFERFYFGYLLGTYYTPFTLDMQIAYNYNSSALQSIQILPDNYSATWGGQANWGAGSTWGGPANVFKARYFPQKQKCESFQIVINETYDASLGVAPGAGLTLSGMLVVAGVKRGFRTQSAAKSFG